MWPSMAAKRLRKYFFVFFFKLGTSLLPNLPAPILNQGSVSGEEEVIRGRQLVVFGTR